MVRREMTGFPIIGVTGGTGGGKSTVARLLAGYGGFVIDADALSHAAIKSGRPAYNAIVEAFGDGVLATDGEIDRKKLGAMVFGNRTQLTRLEQIIHPHVTEETLVLIRQSHATGSYKFVVIDAPLLIEAGIHIHCDSVWLVTASPTARTARITARDALSPAEANRRVESRRDMDALLPYANAVITNDGNEMSLARCVAQTLHDTFPFLF